MLERVWRKGNPSTLLVGMQTSTATMETPEDEMVGWHQLNGQESEQAPGVGDRQGSLACYSPWDCKESDMP